MNHNSIETAMGAVVLAVAGVFLVFAMRTARVDTSSGYPVTALFSNANGLSPGSDVRIGGVKVGSVASVSLDPQTYQAVATLSLRDSVTLPTDTSATIRSESLMGGKYMALEPGADDAMLKPGGRIAHTQSTPDLEQMLGQAIFSMSKGPATSPEGGAVSQPVSSSVSSGDGTAHP